MLQNKKEKVNGDLQLKLSFKWGLDGTGGGGKYHQEGNEDKNNIMTTKMVILQIENESTGEIFHRNPLANFCSSQAPR